MSLLNYFQPSKELPTTEQTGLPARVLREAVKEALNATNVPKKRKYTMAFTAEDRTTIGHYVSENGNAAAVKRFRATHARWRQPLGHVHCIICRLTSAVLNRWPPNTLINMMATNNDFHVETGSSDSALTRHFYTKI